MVSGPVERPVDGFVLEVDPGEIEIAARPPLDELKGLLHL